MAKDTAWDPALDAAAITPSDSVNFALSRGVYVGVAGNLVAIMGASGNAITFTGVLAGTVLPIRCIRINSTGTTATNLVRLF